MTPDKPFFVYYASPGTHAPSQVPKEWLDKYKGKFDEGWDKAREQTLARQKALGIVPPNTQLTPKPTQDGDARLGQVERRGEESLHAAPGDIRGLRRGGRS